jgi:CRISPR/Cas system-associated endonuclease/helicase Cas3
MEDHVLIVFKNIYNFVNELAETFGTRQHPLELYKTLLEKTTFMHEKAIKKHIELFKTFCLENKKAIETQNDKFLSLKMIKYSDRVHIDMGHVFTYADKDTKKIIWRHILAIAAYLDPTIHAKELLRNLGLDARNKDDSALESSRNALSNDTKEEQFLTSLIEKVEGSVDPDSLGDPMKAVSSIMSSGAFTDLMESMQTGIDDGSLDLNKLLGTVQGMLGSGGGGQSPLNFDMMSLLSNIK